MESGTPQTVLGRMAASALASEERPGEMTAARALRLALVRAAEAAAGLRLSVQGVSQEVLALDAMCDRLPHGELILALTRKEVPAGLAALDSELRAAVLEAQTLGAPTPVRAEARPPTETDAALAVPVIDAFLSEFLDLGAGTALGGWTRASRSGGTLEGPRAARLTLPEADYRLVGLSVTLGAGDREGVLLLALPAAISVATAVDSDSASSASWRASLEAATLGAPLTLEAVLARVELPVSRLSELAAGTVLPIDGASIEDISVEASGGHVVGAARLGRLGGLRALRMQSERSDEEGEAPTLGEPPLLDRVRDEGSLTPPGPSPEKAPPSPEPEDDDAFPFAPPLSFDLPD